MTATATRIAAPVLLWALHFIVVYALVSAACGPRALLGPELLRVVVSLVTLLPAILCVVLLIIASRALRRHGEPADLHLASAGWWAAAISTVAILVNVTPVALLDTCTG
jgi:hypothetical protein